MRLQIFVQTLGHDMFQTALHARRDGMLDVTEDIVVFMLTSHYILWKALKYYCLLG